MDDEVELTALLQLGSRRGSGNAAAVAAQRRALAASLTTKLDHSALSSLSGVKATSLLAALHLESLRMQHCFSLPCPSFLSRTPSSSQQGYNERLYSAQAPPLSPWAWAMPCVLAYLRAANPRPGVRQCYSAVVFSAFDAGIAAMRAQLGQEYASMGAGLSLEGPAPAGSVAEQCLEAHTCGLLRGIHEPVEFVRDMSLTMLSSLRSAFPHVLWSATAVATLCALLEHPARVAAPQPGSPETAADSDRDGGEDSGREAQRAQGSTWQGGLRAQQEKSKAALRDVARDWFASAYVLAPLSTQALLQEHLSPVEPGAGRGRGSSLRTHAALVSLLAALPTPSLPQDAAAEEGSLLAQCVSESLVKATHRGLVSGFAACAPAPALESTGPADVDHARDRDDHARVSVAPSSVRLQLLGWASRELQRFEPNVSSTAAGAPLAGLDSDFQEHIGPVQSGPCSAEDPQVHVCSTLSDALFFVAAALLCLPHIQGEREHRVLRLLCGVPVRCLTVEALEAGTRAWSWLLGVRPEWGPVLLGAVVGAWEESVRSRRGLFSGGDTEQGPAEMLRPRLNAGHAVAESPAQSSRKGGDEEQDGEADGSRASARVAACLAHGVLLRWLADRLEVVAAPGGGHSAAVQTQLIQHLLQLSLRPLASASLTHHPGARSPLFSLFLLALRLCECRIGLPSTRPAAQTRPKRASQDQDPADFSAHLLLQHTLRCCLLWFSAAPEWYDYGALTRGQGHSSSFSGPAPSRLDTLSSRGSHNDVALTSHLLARVQHLAMLDSLQIKDEQLGLLLLLLRHELHRCLVWAHPFAPPSTPLGAADRWSGVAAVPAQQWASFARASWEVSPSLAVALALRFPPAHAFIAEVSRLAKEHPLAVRSQGEAVRLIVAAEREGNSNPQRQQQQQRQRQGAGSGMRLEVYWAPCSIPYALSLLAPPHSSQASLVSYAVATLNSYRPSGVLFFMPQLVQALRYDHYPGQQPEAPEGEDGSSGSGPGGPVEDYLLDAAKRDPVFGHTLIWQLQGEEADPNADLIKERAPESEQNALWGIVPRVRERIISSFSAPERALFDAQFKFFDAVTSISGTLRPVPKEERRAAIKPELEKIEVPKEASVYLPTDPDKIVKGIVTSSGIPLQSAKKVPIMVTFTVVHRRQPDSAPQSPAQEEEEEEQTPFPQACIFKVGDDCRQDVLALQVLELLRDINTAVGLDLYLFPYGVLPTGYERGIIEVVPHTRSRNQMGDVADGGLYDIFLAEFGAEGSPELEAARACFIQSAAAYAVGSLILQPKDRHNGNLLIDSRGHLVHIDFGFILETSPGGNMRFESADFKLSHEMTQIIDPDGAMRSEQWHEFVCLTVRGYLAARQHAHSICETVALMLDSGLPCFSRGDPLGNLSSRFHLDMSEREAAAFMAGRCKDAYNKWTTAGYDLIQYLQQGILK